MNIMKSITAREMFIKFPDLRKQLWAGKLWAQGYYVATVGDKFTSAAVRRYIKNQRKYNHTFHDAPAQDAPIG